MKNSKRILAAFLVVLMVMSCFAAGTAFAQEPEDADFAELAGETATTEATQQTTETAQTNNTGTFSDVSDSDKFAQAVKVLNKLAIINGYPDGTFGPSKNVTRAEFAAMLLRMLGMDQTTTPINKPFPDVETTFWAAGTIEIAKSLNIVTGYGDGTFGPNNNVSYEEALTMIIRSIGYENYGEPGAAWYSRYVNAANRLKINDNAIGAVGTPATRACIAQFIYNTLEVNSRENDKIQETTIMEEYLGLIKAEGVITSNGVTSLVSPDIEVFEGEITIKNKEGNEETFVVSNIDEYIDKLGSKGTYYYRENISTGEKEIVLFTARDGSKAETVKADMLKISECDDLTIVYYKNDDQDATQELTLDEKNVVIYNDKLYGNNASASRFDKDMLPTLGSVRVLNTDSDKDYDIVFIDSYEVYVVSTVTTSNYKITDRVTAASKEIVLDEKASNQEIVFENKGGEKRSFSDIKKNSTLCIKKSRDGVGTKRITVVIVDDKVIGEVQSVSSDGDRVKVNGTYYDVSLAAPWINEGGDAPEEEKKYTFFLDLNGDIVASTESAAAADSSTYGFIIGYGKKRGSGLDDSPVYLNILTASGKTVYPLYKNTKINGRSIRSDFEGAVETLENAAKHQSLGLDEEAREEMGARQLIKFKTKSVDNLTVVDEIVTVTDETNSDTKGGDKKADELRMYSGFTSKNNANYGSSALTSNGNKVYIGSAVVFIVPDDVTDVDAYKKGSSSNFKSTGNYVEIFDMSSSKGARVIVLYGGNKAAEVKVSATTALFRVAETFGATNNGEAMLKVTGYENGASGTPREYWVSPSSESLVKNLSEGDVVRFGRDSDGFVTLESKNILYRTYGGTEPFYRAEEVTAVDSDSAKKATAPDLQLALGSIYAVEDGVVVIAPEFLEAGEEYDIDVTDLTKVLRLATGKFSSSVKYYEYDMTGSSIKITELTDFTIDSFNTYVEEVDATKVLIHLKDGAIKSVMILED